MDIKIDLLRVEIYLRVTLSNRTSLCIIHKTKSYICIAERKIETLWKVLREVSALLSLLAKCCNAEGTDIKRNE